MLAHGIRSPEVNLDESQHVVGAGLTSRSAGRPIFILTDSAGNEYVMQSYAQIVDPTVMYRDLPDLASELNMTLGWHYHRGAHARHPDDKQRHCDRNQSKIYILVTLK